VLVVVKPGAAIFQYLIILPIESCSPDAGYAYRCEVNLPETIFPSNKVVLYEDAERMTKASGDYVSRHGDGHYAVEFTKDGKYQITLAPAGNTDPSTTEKSYRAYFGILFFQPAMGIVYLIFLLLGAFRFILFAFSAAKDPKEDPSKPRYATPGIDRFFATQQAAVSDILASLRSALSQYKTFFWVWEIIFVDTGLAFCGLILLEWLFLITGSSFMDGMNSSQRIEVLLLSMIALMVFELVLLGILMAFSFFLRTVRIPEIPVLLAEIVPAGVLSTILVLMMDNFTYVVFHFGILTSSGLLRAIYGIFIGILFVSIYSKRVSDWGSKGNHRSRTATYHWLSGFLFCICGIALAIGIRQYEPRMMVNSSPNQTAAVQQDHPNILLIGTDGLSARNMSLYGYQRKTTPILDGLSDDLLVAENAFTNAGSTAGSITSMFTSKWPTRTGVLYPPNILAGADALEHLPGILSREGYATVQIGVPHYVDAYTVNIQEGFDIVNGTPAYNDPLIQTMRYLGYETSAYFVYLLEEKITSRIFQAFYIDIVENPFTIVTKASSSIDDQEMITQIVDLLSRSEKPLFIHAHLMGTHGATFDLAERTFSQGQIQTDWWMTDFYDDAILSFDQKIGTIIDFLQESDKYKNTILIIYSDHAMAWGNLDRIPLIFHFPEDRYAGRITTNTQNLDIAPTIVDFLGWEVPEWMDGLSLLEIGPDRGRLIYSTRPDNKDIYATEQGKILDVHEMRPPFYQFRALDLIVCNRWYELDLRTYAFDSGTIAEHTDPCTENEYPNQEEIMQFIISFLEKQGYDVSSLR